MSHYANAIRSVRVGRGFDSLLVHCRSVGFSVKFKHVFSEFDASAGFPEANFPKIHHNFRPFIPNQIFPKICHNFGTFIPGPIFPNICRILGIFPNIIFGNFLLLNSSWVHCRSVGLSVVFNTVFSECGARTEFPEPNFPKNLFQAARLDQCSLR